jgi:predicted DNA-binding transcriptional regulator YafY
MPRKILERFFRIDNLIRRKATGNSLQLANRLEISESSVYEYLAIMKSMGAPIHFSKEHNSYYYDEEVNFRFFFEKK